MKLDHREIGRKLDLFMFHELSPGSPIWLPKGTILYNILADGIRKYNASKGYEEVRTPILWKSELYRISGHMEHYQKNMFHVLMEQDEEWQQSLKPMNCPGHMLIYKSKQFSYNDLPYRLHDQGVLHRKETSGAVGGLTRCRAFCQDDGHVFLTPEQIEAEVVSMIEMVQAVYSKFDMQVRSILSTRPDDFMGTASQWDQAEAMLQAAMSGEYAIEMGHGAFYGPKIDFFIKDNQGREWQTATIQLDFQLPQRFDLGYTDKDGQRKPPVVIHRAYYGSFERFIAILLEHYQGKLPLWLAPVQGVFLPLADRHGARCKELQEAYQGAGLRVEVDASNRTLSRKIVDLQERLIPYGFVVGDKEIAAGTVSTRKDGKDQGDFNALRQRIMLEEDVKMQEGF